MSNGTTINDLVTRVRTRGDVVGSSSFDDVVELKPWIKGSLSQFHEILVQRWRDYYATQLTFSLIAGQDVYSLPSDFRLLQDCFVYTGSDYSRQRLQSFDTDQWAGGQSSTGTLRYRIMRDRIYFSPTPSASAYNAICLLYTPHFKAPLLDYSPIDDVFPNGWEEWAVLDVLQKMNVKVRLLNMDDILKTKAMVEDRLIRAGVHRSGDPPRMRNRYNSIRYGCMPTGPGPLYWAGP